MQASNQYGLSPKFHHFNKHMAGKGASPKKTTNAQNILPSTHPQNIISTQDEASQAFKRTFKFFLRKKKGKFPRQPFQSTRKYETHLPTYLRHRGKKKHTIYCVNNHGVHKNVNEKPSKKKKHSTKSETFHQKATTNSQKTGTLTQLGT